jgi:hypothetical protein
MTVDLLFVELNIRSIWAAQRVGQLVASVAQTKVFDTLNTELSQAAVYKPFSRPRIFPEKY